jgi:uncharacterized SAM-binding protein YcdF (DUF218 family)
MRRSVRVQPAETATDPLQDSNRMARSKNSTRRRNSSAEPTYSLRTISIMVGIFLSSIIFILVGMKSSNVQVPTTTTGVRLFHSPSDIPEKTLARFDAILVLGGGVPQSLEEPPAYVQRRCDDAASVVENRKIIQPTKYKKRNATAYLPILCLSAGTAHLPQLMSADGLPIWESTASAAYLQKRYGLVDNVYVETTSFDTIGNAFYARTAHTDIAGWKRLLIVTNEVREVHYIPVVMLKAFTCCNSQFDAPTTNQQTHSRSCMQYNSSTWFGQEQFSTGYLALMAMATSYTIYPLQTWVSATMLFRLGTRKNKVVSRRLRDTPRTIVP